jgi:2,3-bisphosphoglycerate-dependent phosphoglycerate mutase
MKLTSLIFLAITLMHCKNDASTDSSKSSSIEHSEELVTTIYLIRHAEKDLSTSNNPDLTEEGILRAQNWSDHFKDIAFDKVYSSNFTRTKKTATPTAEHNNLEIEIYSPERISAKNFLEVNNGKTILMVGHSNTIPFFVNDIIGENIYDEIDETVYNHLYKITIKSKQINHNLSTVD